MGPLLSPTGNPVLVPHSHPGRLQLSKGVGSHGSLGHSSGQQNALYSNIPWQPHKGHQNHQSHGQRWSLCASRRAGSCALGCQEARNWQDAPWPCSAHRVIECAQSQICSWAHLLGWRCSWARRASPGGPDLFFQGTFLVSA